MKFKEFAVQTRMQRRGEAGFTLIEVVFAAAIAGLVLAGMFEGYNMAGRQAQFSACNMAANAMAESSLEQVLAADWVPSYQNNTFLGLSSTNTANLCLPGTTGATATCTNIITVSQVSSIPPYAMVKVQCIWDFPTYGGTFTNTVCVLRAPNS